METVKEEKHNLVTAQIKITCFQECPRNAVKSVLKHKSRFTQLIIADMSYDAEKEYYDEWAQDIDALREAHIEVVLCKELNISRVTGDYILSIHPYCEFKKSVLDTFDELTSSSTTDQTEFSIACETQMSTFSLWYGFFLVIAFWNFLWERWEQHKFSRETDLKVSAVIRHGKHRYLSRWRPLNYVFNPSTAPRTLPEVMDIAVVSVPKRARGFRFLHSYLYNDKWFGVWWFYWIPFFRIWTYLYAFYWVITLGALLQGWKTIVAVSGVIFGTPGALATIMEPVSLVILGGIFLNAMIVFVATAIYYRFPRQNQMVFTFPFYVLAFPFVLFYARMVKVKN